MMPPPASSRQRWMLMQRHSRDDASSPRDEHTSPDKRRCIPSPLVREGQGGGWCVGHHCSHSRDLHPQPLPTRRRGAQRGAGIDRMPSLKDMRVRIAATKATQKITKAMQMVAVSKLRRAQAAAEAARPYAERMAAALRNIATSVAGLDSAPALLRGTDSDQVHLLLVCTAERGLCGPFNSAIVRLVREHVNKLLADGKEVKIFC